MLSMLHVIKALIALQLNTRGSRHCERWERRQFLFTPWPTWNVFLLCHLHAHSYAPMPSKSLPRRQWSSLKCHEGSSNHHMRKVFRIFLLFLYILKRNSLTELVHFFNTYRFLFIFIFASFLCMHTRCATGLQDFTPSPFSGHRYTNHMTLHILTISSGFRVRLTDIMYGINFSSLFIMRNKLVQFILS